MVATQPERGDVAAVSGDSDEAPGSAPTPGRPELLALARRRFLQGERLDMQGMSAELGVSRTTVYRWGGNQRQLMAEVLSSLAFDAFQAAEQGVRGNGRSRVLAVYTNFLRIVAASDAVRVALRRDPHQFLRVVTGSGPVNRTVRILCEELLHREVERGALRVPTDVGALASAMVAVGEAVLYADLLAGMEPDVDRSAEVLRLLLAPTA